MTDKNKHEYAMNWSPDEIRWAICQIINPVPQATEHQADADFETDLYHGVSVASESTCQALAKAAGVTRVEPQFVSELLRLGRAKTGDAALARESAFLTEKAAAKNRLRRVLRSARSDLSILDRASEASQYCRVCMTSRLHVEASLNVTRAQTDQFNISGALSVTDLLDVLELSVELTPPERVSRGAPNKTLKRARVDLALLSYARLRFMMGCEPGELFKRGDLRYPLKLYGLMANNDGSSEPSLKRMIGDRRRFWTPFVLEFATELVDRKLKGKPLGLLFPSLLAPEPIDPWLQMRCSEEQENIRKNKDLANRQLVQKLVQEDQAKMVARWIEQDKNRSTEAD